MTHERLEAVSALVDGEEPGDSARVIDELVRDESLRRTWGRYHLASEALRGRLPARLDPGMGSRISAALRGEATVLAPARVLRGVVLRPLAGLAVAASVAALALLGIQSNRTDPTLPPTQAAVALQAPPAQAGGTFTFASGHPGKLAPRPRLAGGQVSARMNRYLVNYNEYRGNAAMQGMFPYVRIVAHENNE